MDGGCRAVNINCIIALAEKWCHAFGKRIVYMDDQGVNDFCCTRKRSNAQYIDYSQGNRKPCKHGVCGRFIFHKGHRDRVSFFRETTERGANTGSMAGMIWYNIRVPQNTAER